MAFSVSTRSALDGSGASLPGGVVFIDESGLGNGPWIITKVTIDPAGVNTQFVLSNNAAKCDISSINGTTTAVGHGTAAGALRVELPTDGTGLVNAAQSGTWNVGTLTSITNAVTVAQATAANLNATVTGTVAATQSGTWTVQQGGAPWSVTIPQSNVTADYDTGAGTQTMTMWGLALPASGGAVAGGTATNPVRTDPTGTTTQPVSGTVTANAGTGTFTVSGTVAATQSGNWTSRIVGNAGGVMDAAGQNATSPANELLVAGQFNTAPTTITSGNVSPLQLDSAGNLLVNVKAGGASGGTSSSFGAAFPGTGTAIGVKNGANMVNLAADASSNLLVSLAASTATVTVSGTVTANQGGAPWAENITQFGGVALSTGTGVSGTGIPRVTVSNDSTLADIVTTGSITTTQSVTANTSGQSSVGVSISGSFTGTLVFEATVDGSTWVPTSIVQIANGTISSSTTGPITAQANCGGLAGFRVRGNTVSVGTASVTLRAGVGVSTVMADNPMTVTGTVAATQSGSWTVAATQSGTWTVQQGTPPWTVNPGTAANWAIGATSSTLPANAILAGTQAITALPTAATNGQLTDVSSDKFGRPIVLVGTIRDLTGTQTTTISASTAETTIVTAGAAGVFNDLVMLIVSNTSTATNTRIDFRDTTGGSILFSLQSNGGQNPVGFALAIPIPQTTAATNWTAQCATSTTDIRIYAVFAKNK